MNGPNLDKSLDDILAEKAKERRGQFSPGENGHRRRRNAMVVTTGSRRGGIRKAGGPPRASGTSSKGGGQIYIRQTSFERRPRTTRVSVFERLGERVVPRENELARSSTRSGALLSIDNLKYTVNNSDIHDLFKKFGRIKRAFVVYNRETGRSSGRAEVTFERVQDALHALREYDGVALDGRRMKITLETSKDTHSPRELPVEARLGHRSNRIRLESDRMDV
mmetsp:Transcript_5924/g.11686  ORF Transcript_5924/g.11686 Transcript_5924/m.11686 type:complete len:222 (+) Transcript_5924:1257-1922(+)